MPLELVESGNAAVLTETLNGSGASTIWPGPTSPLVLAATSERVY